MKKLLLAFCLACGAWAVRPAPGMAERGPNDTIYAAVDEPVDARFPDTLAAPADTLCADSPLPVEDGEKMQRFPGKDAALSGESAAGNRADTCISLAGCMAELLQRPFLATSDVGIAIYDLTADSMLYAYHSGKLYRPASVQKLFTAVTALHLLGADHAVQTLMLADSAQQDSILPGNLYLRGGFDSEFSEADMELMVEGLQRLGIRRIAGKVYADVSMKDSVPYNPGWSWDDAYYYYQPELTPLIYHKGYLTLRLTASSSRRRSRVSVYPETGLYPILNRTGGSGRFRLYRNLSTGSRQIIVQGRVRRRCTERITVPRPYELFADVFLSRLSAAGIQTGGYGGLRPAPLPADTLGGVARALQPILNRALKNSDNLSAESLFFQAAYEYVNAGRPSGERIPCTAADGAEAVRALFSEIGMDASAYGISDGCGLSPYDRTSADAVVVFLRYAASRPELFYPIYNALSVAGTDGTLRRRMRGTPAEGNVRGKTGSVTGVSSLAGYLTAPDGHLLAFAILNQNARRSSEARKFQDAVCTLLCSRAVRP